MSFLAHFWHYIVGALPWAWAQYPWMHKALLAVLLAAPFFALIGTQVVGQRLVFFSDTLGHAALAGLGVGVVAGLAKPWWAMLAWAVIIALLMTWVQRRSRAAMDTVLGVFMAFSVALGVALLSHSGQTKQLLNYLVGDVLSITGEGLAGLALALLITLVLAWRWFNALALTGLNASLAGSRGVRVAWVQAGFAVLVAVAVTMVIPWIGLLLINAFLVLPAAAARLLARNMGQYLAWAVALALAAGIGGLISSYYWDTPTGATIVLWSVAFYALALLFHPRTSSSTSMEATES
ncbi:MAG TPA: metal ABC transporter permease [Opitutales bacterium]|nr:metal ABC transporter permease [Opitutales bacterium]